nr:hypothetical protein CFP56_16536 [Quercus suber]
MLWDDHSAQQPSTPCFGLEPINVLRISTSRCSSRRNAGNDKIDKAKQSQAEEFDDSTFSCSLKALAKVPSLVSSPRSTDCSSRFWTPEATVCLPKRARIASEPLSPEDTVVETPAIVQLLATGFREAISSLPRRRLDGIESNSSNDFSRLSNIAPALFVPGYLSNVTSRTVFLPLLSHALLNVGFKNAHSTSLRCKVSQLLHINPTMSWAARHENADQETLASKLFGLVQRGVLDPKASRRLEPIIPSCTRPSPSDDACVTSMLESTSNAPSSQDSLLLHDSFDDVDALDDLDILSVFEEHQSAAVDAHYAPPCISNQAIIINDDSDADDAFSSMSLESDLDSRTRIAYTMDAGFSDDDHEQDDLLSIPDDRVRFPPLASSTLTSLPEEGLGTSTPVLEPQYLDTETDIGTVTDYDETYEEMLLQ